GQVARKKRKLLTHPFNQLFCCSGALSGEDLIIVNQSKTGLMVERDHPEPEAFSTKVICGKPIWRVSSFGSVFLEPDLARREISQLINIHEAIHPQEKSAVSDRILQSQAELLSQELSSARSIHDPLRLD